ncbi:O-antigen ligase family protein [Sphingomonas sp. CFBP 13720]|uniref:O-antigen ligase family protein n=1 Tax=Sphingomonas sp. CFBP 13720 TaxID=2775302 RepID=UPI001780435D|nr:O-antigen ligase family protein [Sphingomonas sp. CFBP 13720]MBD8679940.1 O-antigen ligase family protein [Sphingomonas sp. CFBP 13720]
MARHRSDPLTRPGLYAILLGLFLCTLWIAGGASRADALGQVVVRSAAAIVLAVAALFGNRPALRPVRPVALLLVAALSLALLQLVPLPPDIWLALPGRAPFAEAAAASGQPQPWRPWSIVPGATANSVAALIVPITTLILVAGLRDHERRWLPGMMLCLIVAATLIGLLQFSGAGFDNPFVNDDLGQVAGTFANYNHFALLLAMGCLLAPVWGFSNGGSPGWRAAVAAGLLILFTLTVLASGSRAGTALSGIALVIGLVLVRRPISQALSRYPRWVFPAMVAAIIGLIAILVLVSIASDRAISINRAITVDPWQDMRRRGLPTVLEMVRTYFPFGTGLGSFDPLFRMHEPFDLLKPTYFNHAHDDLLEIVLDAGLPGLLLLLAALAWWGRSSLRAWRAGPAMRHALPRLGSAMLLLVLLASVIDYPARTPIMMALIVIAAVWLGDRNGGRSTPALPEPDQHL